MSFIQPGEVSIKWTLTFVGIAFIAGAIIGSWITLLARIIF